MAQNTNILSSTSVSPRKINTCIIYYIVLPQKRKSICLLLLDWICRECARILITNLNTCNLLNCDPGFHINIFQFQVGSTSVRQVHECSACLKELKLNFLHPNIYLLLDNMGGFLGRYEWLWNLGAHFAYGRWTILILAFHFGKIF